MPRNEKVNRQELRDLALLFLRLGATSFGGPVAHIAMMEHEVVTRRQWLDRQRFVDLIGATTLIPGPNSTELAIYIGRERAGWPGLIVAGTAFILPAAIIVLALSWVYARFGTLPSMRWVLYAIQPVVIAIIVQALWKFSRTALKGAFTIAVALAAAVLNLCGVSAITVIVLAAVVGLLAGWLRRWRDKPRLGASGLGNLGTLGLWNFGTWDVARGALGVGGASLAVSPTLVRLFLIFLKIGSILYGSGYALLAFLRADLVQHLHWLTDQQLIDAVTVGQMTPGPVFTTATFIGYQIAGLPGAVASTLGIFLPSFLFVGLLNMMMQRLRASVVMRAFLDAVNAASLALMAVVTMQLARVTFLPQSALDPIPIIIALAALSVLIRTRLNSAWLIAAGGVIGLGFAWLR